MILYCVHTLLRAFLYWNTYLSGQSSSLGVPNFLSTSKIQRFLLLSLQQGSVDMNLGRVVNTIRVCTMLVAMVDCVIFVKPTEFHRFRPNMAPREGNH